MKLTFNSIILHNFLSFGHAEIDLKDKGYTLISGVNHNPSDLAKSNGSGKSTIFSGLCYALTGETIQGLSRNLNNMFNPGDMYVTLDFNVNADNYVITRSRTESNKSDLKVVINGQDKSGKGITESEQVLAEHIPDLTSELVGEVIIIGQGMPHKFSNNSPSGRKELLERLSHSDFMLEDIKRRIEARTATLREAENNLQLKKVELDTKTTIASQTLAEAEKSLGEIDLKATVNFDALIKECNDKLLERDKALDDANKVKQDLDSKVNNLNTKVRELNTEKQSKITEEFEEFNKHNVTVKSAIAEHKLQINNIAAEITKMKNVKDICPFCGQKIPNVVKQDTSKQEEEKANLEKELADLVEKDSKQEESFRLNKQDIEKYYADQEKKYTDELTSLRAEQMKADSDIKAILSDIRNLEVQKLSHEKDKEQVEKDRERLNATISNTRETLDNLSKEILYIIKDMDSNREHQAVIAKMSTLVKRDFRGILLANIINYLDKKCKEYSNEIFGTTELAFKLEGNNINVTYLGKPLEALSGGEQQKVDLILQFAIRCMMQEYTGFTSNILVLDEILDNLDSTGCDQILNFITNRLSDIESIFIISHHADSLNIGNDSEIIVVKDAKGVSYIQ